MRTAGQGQTGLLAVNEEEIAVADQFFFQLNDVSQGLPAVEYMDLVRLRS